MVPNSIKVPAAFEYVFPEGCLFVSVDKATDWEKRNSGGDDPGKPHLNSSIEQGFLPVFIARGTLQSFGLDPAPATGLTFQ